MTNGSNDPNYSEAIRASFALSSPRIVGNFTRYKHLKRGAVQVEAPFASFESFVMPAASATAPIRVRPPARRSRARAALGAMAAFAAANR